MRWHLGRCHAALALGFVPVVGGGFGAARGVVDLLPQLELAVSVGAEPGTQDFQPPNVPHNNTPAA